MANDADQPIDAPLPESVERVIAELHVLGPAARAVVVQELCSEYPQHQDEIEALVALRGLDLKATGVPTIDGLSIVRKLGRGGSGRRPSDGR